MEDEINEMNEIKELLEDLLKAHPHEEILAGLKILARMTYAERQVAAKIAKEIDETHS